MSPIRIALADDHVLVRAGFRAMLDALDDVLVVGEATDGLELLQLLSGSTVDVALVDLTMPRLDGIATCERIRERHPQVRVVLLSMHADADAIRRAVAGGACGYLTKDLSCVELAHALHCVAANGSYYSPAVSLQLLRDAGTGPDEGLTERQMQILRLLARGKGSKEIAFALGLSPSTVDMHRLRIMRRLGLNNVAGLTRYALRKGLITP